MPVRLSDRLVEDVARRLAAGGRRYTARQLWYAVCAAAEPRRPSNGAARLGCGVILVLLAVAGGILASIYVGLVVVPGLVVIGLGLQELAEERRRPTTRPLVVGYVEFVRDHLAPLVASRPDAAPGLIAESVVVPVAAAVAAGIAGPLAPSLQIGTPGTGAVPSDTGAVPSDASAVPAGEERESRLRGGDERPSDAPTPPAPSVDSSVGEPGATAIEKASVTTLVVADSAETAVLVAAAVERLRGVGTAAIAVPPMVAGEEAAPEVLGRAAPDLVLAVHDADPRGCGLAGRLRKAGARRVVDVAIRPGQVAGRRVQVLEGAPTVVDGSIGRLLAPDEIVWLAEGRRVEFATLTPVEVERLLENALADAAAGRLQPTAVEGILLWRGSPYLPSEADASEVASGVLAATPPASPHGGGSKPGS